MEANRRREENWAMQDNVRFSVSDSEQGFRFDWICVDGLPNGERINKKLGTYFAGRAVDNVDMVYVGLLLQSEAAGVADEVAQVVQDYCEYLSRLRRN